MTHPSRSILSFLLFLALTAAGPLHAHNGEYVSPGHGWEPLSGTPRKGSPGPRSKPGSTPRQGGGSGGATSGRLVPTSSTPGSTTADPDSVQMGQASPWQEVFEVLRWGLPDGTPTATRGLRNRVRDALVQRLSDKSHEVRRFALLALGRLGAFDEAGAAVRADPAQSWGIGLLGPGLALRNPVFDSSGPPIQEVLVPILADRKRGPADRVLAAVSLSMGGPEQASALLEAMQGMPAGPIQDGLLFALGLTGHPGAREVLLNRILPPKEDGAPDDPASRALFLYSLSRNPGPDVTGDLHRRLTDPSAKVQAAAALCIAGRKGTVLGGEGALRKLAAAAPALPRSAALLSLCLAGDARAAELSRRAMADPSCRSNGTAALAALTLGLLGSAEDGPDLVALFADSGAPEDLRQAAAVAAGLVRARDGTRKMVMGIRRAHDPLVASYGLLGLSLIDGKAALPLIKSFLGSSDQVAVRRILIISLGYAGGEGAEKLLVKAYGDSYLVNREAPPALFRLNPELAVEEILKRLSDEKNRWARRFAAIALGRCFEGESPSFFGSVLLGTGMGKETSMERLMIYVESES